MIFYFSLLKYTYHYNYRSHISLQVAKLAKSAGVQILIFPTVYVFVFPSSRCVCILQSCASVNLANNHGNTAMHEAVRGGHQALVELLLQEGGLVHLRNKRQRTPLDCAQETGSKVRTSQPGHHSAYSQNTDKHGRLDADVWPFAILIVYVQLFISMLTQLGMVMPVLIAS